MTTAVTQASAEHHSVPEAGILEKYQRPESFQSLKCAQFLMHQKHFTQEDGDKTSPNPKYFKLLRYHQNKQKQGWL